MKPVAFDYYRPQAVPEVTALLSQKGDEAAILAGGMTLGPMLNLRVVRPRAVIDISRIEALKTISVTSKVVVTGAGVIQNHALSSDVIAMEIPLLAMALPWVGHFQTRNRGTLGGSVAHADPSAEIPLALVVCGGSVVLPGSQGSSLAAQEFASTVVVARVGGGGERNHCGRSERKNEFFHHRNTPRFNQAAAATRGRLTVPIAPLRLSWR